jgi:PleD family two-component response regulator
MMDVGIQWAQKTNPLGPDERKQMVVDAPDILSARILIVDDQESNVSLLTQLLNEAGYCRVTSSMNSQEVCALHRKEPYDLCSTCRCPAWMAFRSSRA